MKLKIIKSNESLVLSKVGIYLITPCVILNAFQVDYSNDIGIGLLFSFLVALFLHVIFIFISHVMKNKWGFDSVETASIVYPNAGNLTIPLVMAILGNEWVIYASVFMSVQQFFLWSHGRMLFSDENDFDIRKVIRNINMISIIVGIIMMLTGIRFPTMINETLTSMTGMVVLTMIITGMILADMDLIKIFTTKRVYLISSIRILVLPIFIVLFFKLLIQCIDIANIDKILMITLLAAAGPSASSITQFAMLYEKQVEHASSINIMTTVLCIITIPIFVAILYA